MRERRYRSAYNLAVAVADTINGDNFLPVVFIDNLHMTHHTEIGPRQVRKQSINRSRLWTLAFSVFNACSVARW
ncbi:MAG: hypothetical protein ACI8TP_003363 [Acidimicrobiales bacterium]